MSDFAVAELTTDAEILAAYPTATPCWIETVQLATLGAQRS